MLEAYATLGFIAAHTEKALLHTLVTGVIYRHPSLLAKQVTTLDVLSGGRAGLGIGAAWNEQETQGLGFAFPARGRTLPPARGDDPDLPADVGGLRGALRRRDLAAGADAEFTAEHLAAASVSHDRRGRREETLRMVAQYADACNLSAMGELPVHKLDVLRGHCDAVGRDYDEIEKTAMIGVNPQSTVDSVADVVSGLSALGFTATYVFSVGIDEPSRVVDLIAVLPHAGVSSRDRTVCRRLYGGDVSERPKVQLSKSCVG